MHTKCVTLLCIFILKCFIVVGEIVSTENGQLNGTTLQTWTEQSFHAFYGIPYAQPPIGILRFAPPLPAQPWIGIRSATSYRPMCWQPSSQGELFEMDEDCLTLNVFTKTLMPEMSSELKPVIVYVHGGGFVVGSASLDAGPRYLLDRDIVYVSLNYRLGAFGFLATGSKEAAGNMGMKDLVLALKWIRDNIRNFGGNPNKITISGMSAGGFAVTALMVSPMAKNLFHGVITHSGAIAFPMGIKRDYLEAAISIAKELGCTDNDPAEFVLCLRSKPARDIINATKGNGFHCSSWLVACISWLPVIEPDYEQERFLIEDPNESFRKGKFHQVPVIAGITTNEFAINALVTLSEANLKQLNENYDEVAPKCFAYANAKDSKSVGDVLRKAYFPFDVIDARSFNNLNNFFSDGIIGIGVHRFVHFISKLTKVFYYEFSYRGRYSVFNYPHNHPYGTHHSDDMQYIMSECISPLYQTSDPEHVMVERMTRIYEQFAWSGDPNNDLDVYLNEMNWPKHDELTEYYMDIGTNFVEKQGLNLERYTVWDRLSNNGASNIDIKSDLIILITILISTLFRL